MAYIPFNYAKPDPAVDTGTDAFNNTRANLLALRDSIALGALPGWAMDPDGGTGEQPATITYSKGTERIRLSLTWGTTGGADGNVQTVVAEYSSNSGTSYDTIGTETISYDALGNCSGVSWA